MTDAPKMSHRENHRSLTVEHTNSVPDRDVTPLSKLSDGELLTRINMHTLAKPIPSDAAHTNRSGKQIPIPTLRLNSGGAFAHGFPLKI